MYHIIFFSSGKASWFAAKLVAEKFGTENLFLVFADTTIEDSDNYRFLIEASKNVGGKLIWLKDGKNPWDIFFKNKFLSHRNSACSIELKVNPCKKWIKDCEFNPKNTTLYFGIGFEEMHRFSAIVKNWQPYLVEFPLCWDNWVDNHDINEALKAENLKAPRLYDFGFAHANCGGFCPKAGQKQFKKLLEHFPERFDYHSEQEEDFRNLIKKDVAILRKSINKNKGVITLKAFKAEIIDGNLDVNNEPLGGCGCFTETD